VKTYYHGLNQIEIYKAEAKLDLNDYHKSGIVFLFTDKYKFVCHAMVMPITRDHRTGEWLLNVVISTGKNIKLTKPFELILKNHVKELTSEFMYILTGE